MADTVKFIVDDAIYDVPKGVNVVDISKQVANNDIPVFCYHPKLAPVGMCRMCLVEIGQVEVNPDTKQWNYADDGKPKIRWQPKLATACTTTVVDGMAIRTTTQVVKDARDDIIEFLLTSHPLDCPICDKGGECPLQNLTLRHGAGTSRFQLSDKAHFAKHYPLGDLIFLDRERCIQCARCTRFQEEYVGDAVLGFHERGRQLQIVTTSTPEFDTYFSGNTTDICPVGALTTADFRFGARPWELTEVPTICPHCPVGCNMSASTRQDRESGGKVIIKRIMPRQNEQVNEIWVCDKGRFGHHHSRAEDRLTRPLIRKDGKLVPASWTDALSLIATRMQAAGADVGAIAGPMLANEDLFELRRLLESSGSAKLGVWPAAMTGSHLIKQVGLATGSNFKDMGRGTTIVVVATNLEEEAPVWYLRAKVAAGRGARLIVVNARPTEMDRWTWGKNHVRYAYGKELEAVASLKELIGETQNLVIICGGEGLDRAGHGALMQACANLLIETGHVGKPNNGLLAVWPGANTQGAFDMGFSSEATEAILGAAPAVLFLADADIIGDDALHGHVIHEAPFKVAIEMFMTETALQSDVVLPRQSFAERDGSFTNGERRVQRFYTAQAPVGESRPDWKIFAEIGQRLGRAKPKLSAAAVMQDVTRAVPQYAAMSYPNLAKTAKQFPDVGGTDLYYGGTAYDNHGGLGIQWATDAETGAVSGAALPAFSATVRGEGQFLIVPVQVLYDHEVEFEASTPLMHAHIDAPFVLLNTNDANALGIAQGDTVAVNFGAGTVEVTARTDAAAPAGAALLPRHLAAQPTPAVPVAGALAKVTKVEAVHV
jgi:NADH-quinone oxidoreductase subunit G